MGIVVMFLVWLVFMGISVGVFYLLKYDFIRFELNSFKERKKLLKKAKYEVEASLNWIMDLVYLIEMTKSKTKQKKYEENIGILTEKVKTLVDPLVHFNEVRDGIGVIKKDNFDFDKIVKSVLDDTKENAENKNIRFISNISTDLNYFVKGNYKKTKLFIENVLDLFSSIIKIGSIEISMFKNISETDQKVSYSLSFNDVGVEYKDIPIMDIFEKYKKGDFSFIKEYGGIGLKIFLIDSLADQYGFDFKLNTSDVGKGMISLELGFDMFNQTSEVKEKLYKKVQTFIMLKLTEIKSRRLEYRF